MTTPLKSAPFSFAWLNRRRTTGLLGLTLDGGRLDGVVLRRTNGSLQQHQWLSVALSLDPLTNDPELVGREIRNHLDAANVRERRCVVGLPLKWALTAHTQVPNLPDNDLPGFLQLEAERGFPCDVDTLQLATSQYQTAAGERHATLAGVPRNHLALLERVLRAAGLKPLSFTLGLTVLQPLGATASNGVLALAIGETQVGLQVTAGGGVVALRALEGALETEGGQRHLRADIVAREIRITLGQLPAALRDTIRRVRIFGPRDLAQKLADEIDLRLESLSLKVELVTAYHPGDFAAQLPPAATVSSAFSLAANQLAGPGATLEFLPPRVNAWQQFLARYSAGKLQRAGLAAAALALLLAVVFLYPEWQLARLRSQWTKIGPAVRELEAVQKQVRLFRPWFDDSVRSLSVLRQVTEAFPEDGGVTAKTLELRGPTRVSCAGVARDHPTLLKTLDKLRAAPRVSDLKVNVIRGKSPMQFTFDFHWTDGGGDEH
ncbi:MAG: hypothetical protein FJ387_21755 [Verrucomicrobia bacterium]|nr:hypothetical protein [Verrucomicrobiota bacterium]